MKLPDSLFDDPNRLQPTHRDTEPQQPLLREERFDRKGVWRPRSASRSTGCGATSEVSAQRSYLYVFAHATQNRFKIGRSDVPLKRLANLPEADQIDQVQSFRLELPDRRRAREVESMLHKGLAAYRLKLTWFDAQTLKNFQIKGWDGVTEWFSMSGLHHVMDLLRALPESSAIQRVPLQTLDGQPYVVDAPVKFLKESDRLRDEAHQYNLERLDHICHAFMQIKRHLAISWQDGKDSNNPMGGGLGTLTCGGILRLHGYRSWWDLENLTPRMGITDHALWNLKTGKTINALKPCRADRRTTTFATHVTPGTSSPVSSLVALIRFASDEPNDLELVFNHPDRLQKLPAGADIHRRWTQFRKALIT